MANANTRDDMALIVQQTSFAAATESGRALCQDLGRRLMTVAQPR